MNTHDRRTTACRAQFRQKVAHPLPTPRHVFQNCLHLGILPAYCRVPGSSARYLAYSRPCDGHPNNPSCCSLAVPLPGVQASSTLSLSLL